MIRKYKVTYREVLRHLTVEIEATSKYDAKKKFYRLYPGCELVKIEEVEE